MPNHAMIKNTLNKLFKIQCFLAAMTVIITRMIAHEAFAISVAAGAAILLFATLVSILLFRRLPTVIRSKTFYQLMLLNEGLKWLIVGMTCLLLLPHVEPLGLALGFIATYSGYFWILYLDRGK